MDCKDCIHNKVCYRREVCNDIEEHIKKLGCIDFIARADVKKVVRCENCKNYELMKAGNYHFCNEFGGRVTEEDFCSRAQKMDGKEVEEE